ncbi:MAG TPA: FAD-dependent oxidoreductase [Polyangiaceae bacterium]|nr:FAD-dependent oxidoreductase [Polyangiaceae bacterium]
MATLEGLEEQARAIVSQVRDDPAARLALRERFYEKYGGGTPGTYGFGRSELDFMRWEISRGVLNAVTQGGSPWWRSVNLRLMYQAELAALIQEQLPDASPGDTAVRFWLEFIRKPSPMGWYRAHNTSIVDGYLDAVALALAEPWSERVFVNVVLYRLLYAQGLVEGVSLGRLGEILSDPVGDSVDLLVHIPAFYPDKYPLSRGEVQTLLQQSHHLLPEMAADFDDLFVIPDLIPLYSDACGWLGQPGLELLLRDGLPCYPVDQASSQGRGPDREPPPSPGPKRKIAVLGGGLASLAAAYELTSYEGWRDRYEVTLYQIGWRVGGKTSCGFGPGDRIQERGIHIFQGWYENAFRMVQDTYAYMDKHDLAPGSPLPKWTDAFVPDDATLFTEFDQDRGVWTNWPVLFPYNQKLPGVEGPPPLPEILYEAVGLIAELLLGSPYQSNAGCLGKLLSPEIIKLFFTPPWEKSAPDWWKHLADLSDQNHASIEKPEVRWLKQAQTLLGSLRHSPTLQLGPFEVSALRAAVQLFSAAVGVLRLASPADTASENRLAHIVVLAEFGLANLRGMLADTYDEKNHQFDFHLINRYDYEEWLLKNGLPTAFEASAPVRFIYCGAFHNLYLDKPGKLAADMGLRSLLASVTYRGSLVWKLTGGTGGSLTAPLYKMLSHRGVRFEFFNDVEEIHYSAGNEIESFTVGIQVDLAKDRSDYPPLKNVKGLDGWPAEPHYQYLDAEQAERLKRDKIDLESPWTTWHAVRGRVLRRGIDFDDIVLGIPVGATAKICSGIVERKESWKKMVKYVRTTPTLGVQIWLRPTLEDLGMQLADWGMPPGDEPNSVIYADLLYSWTDMGLVMPFEGWQPDDVPGELSYYCGTWPLSGPLPPFSDHGFPARERERLIEYTGKWLGDNMGWFWPKAIKDEKRFDFSLLVDPDDPDNDQQKSDSERLRSQWFVVNIEPTNHYTLAWPDSDQYRLRADQSGYKNLFLCGDWTNFGLNIGHVEGAVTSGLIAAQCALRAQGQTQFRPIFADAGSGEVS